MQTLFNLMIYLAGFGLMELFVKEYKINTLSQIVIYLVIGIIGYHNYKNISNNIDGEKNKQYT